MLNKKISINIIRIRLQICLKTLKNIGMSNKSNQTGHKGNTGRIGYIYIYKLFVECKEVTLISLTLPNGLDGFSNVANSSTFPINAAPT